MSLCIFFGLYSPHQQHNRGMVTLVFQSVTTGPTLPNWNILAVFGLNGTSVGPDIHDLQHPSLLLLPHTEIHPFRCSCFKNALEKACASDHHVQFMWTLVWLRALSWKVEDISTPENARAHTTKTKTQGFWWRSASKLCFFRGTL